MHFTVAGALKGGKNVDLLVIPFWNEKEKIHHPFLPKELEGELKKPLELGDFKAKEGEFTLLYFNDKKCPRVGLLGLGELSDITTETLRRSFAAAAKQAVKGKFSHLEVVVPHLPALSEEHTLRGVVEGLLLANYLFHQLKYDSIQKEAPKLIDSITLITHSKKALQIAEKAKMIADGVYLARDLVNGNADEINPQFLAKVARGLAQTNARIKTTILDKKELEKKGFGLLLAVSRGASHDPVLIVSEYRGNPRSKEITALIGKGVTYDTGGLNLKPTGSMETMKCDMGGAATVLATLSTAASLDLKQNLVAIVPATHRGRYAKVRHF